MQQFYVYYLLTQILVSLFIIRKISLPKPILILTCYTFAVGIILVSDLCNYNLHGSPNEIYMEVSAGAFGCADIANTTLLSYCPSPASQ